LLPPYQFEICLASCAFASKCEADHHKSGNYVNEIAMHKDTRSSQTERQRQTVTITDEAEGVSPFVAAVSRLAVFVVPAPDSRFIANQIAPRPSG
jgi:hypothetical protein